MIATIETSTSLPTGCLPPMKSGAKNNIDIKPRSTTRNKRDGNGESWDGDFNGKSGYRLESTVFLPKWL